jgi:acetyl-CoA carboxylase carboxyl transferase subunit alpha
MNYLEFEKPLAEIEGKAEELRALARANKAWTSTKEAEALDRKAETLLRDLYKDLTPWRKCQVARHPDRPHCKDYIEALFTEWTPLAGDRNFADDHAVMGGLARFNDTPGRGDRPRKGQRHQKPDRAQLRHGAARGLSQGDPADGHGAPLRPAGGHAGRHARRLSRQGRRGTRPGRGDRAQRPEMPAVGVPLISVVIGEGGSGGAVAFATANRVAMLEHSIYSVISPEGCASILWKDAEKMREAAEALRLTAQDLQKLGVIDRIIKEPLGGAQRDPKETIEAVGKALEIMLKELSGKKPDMLIRERRAKFIEMGSKGLAA